MSEFLTLVIANGFSRYNTPSLYLSLASHLWSLFTLYMGVEHVLMHNFLTHFPTLQTDLYPKRGDINGSIEQAIGAGTVFTTTLVNAIHANTILAIGTIAFNMMQVQYIFDPKLYTTPDGTPISIIMQCI